MKGIWGKVLRVNLTTHTWKEEKIPEEVYRKYIGGLGLGSILLYKEVDPKVDPLDPLNKVIITTGPFQGTGIPGSSRWVAVAKSPLTGIIGHTTGGGFFGVELKKTGYDAIVIEGQSKDSVYLWIEDGKVEFRDARKIWGLDAYEAAKAIKEEIGDKKISVLDIGQAGEKLVKFACLVADEGHGIGGRTGLGAVFGSKKLKAIAVKGTNEIEVAKPNELKEAIKEYSKIILKTAESKSARKYGTAAYVVPAEILGDLPKKNWKLGSWKEGAIKISGEAYTEKLLIRPYPCANCPIGCHRYGKVPHKYSKYKISNREGMGPEYESLACLGSLTLVDDLEALVEVNDLCNRFGIDTIETGNIIAFVMECYEYGIITKEMLNGLEAKWGDAETVVRLTEMLAFREGIGDLLAEGFKELIQKFGQKTEEYAIHVKGLALPAHDPRAFFYLGLNYATASRGACHLHGWPHGNFFGILLPEAGIDKVYDRFSEDNIAYMVARYQDWAMLYDSLVQCVYMSFYGHLTLADQAKLFAYVTGINVKPQELLRAGERVFNVIRLFNIDAGVSRESDTLPARILTPLNDGSTKGKAPMFEDIILDEYYKVRKWTKDGKPSEELLKELEIS